jgi:ABC-type Fe3+ transport system substrate-binding protein
MRRNATAPGRSRAAAIAAAAAAFLCGSAASRAVTLEELRSYNGPDREQLLIEGAKPEGQVVFYSGMIQNQAVRPLLDGFHKKYPFLTGTNWRATPEEIFAKATAEARANNRVADVIEGTGIGEMATGAGLAETYRPAILDEYPETYRDPSRRWTVTNLYYYGVAYNTKLVPADSAPKTFEDLLDPKWKGKMAWRVGDPTGGELFIANLLSAWGEDKAMAYLQKLKDQKIINFGAGSARTLVDRVMAGDYPMALNIYANHPLISAEKGAPVATQLLAPVASTAATMVLVKGAPHPFSAMLFIDYILSEEGQKILASAEYYPAKPSVPPVASLSAVVPRIAGYPENFISPARFGELTTKADAIYQSMFR